ncbi:MAG: hypothetical protein LC642_03620 [Verrucomicrobiaceae bacterium]|nr:hypothetical protein [Verrucomicrobiaceae bacterium]
MAFRIHDNVVRGEIDNRSKGIVRGKIWLEGSSAPLTLELQGNAHRDLAGCLLTFSNPGKRFADPHLDALAREQRGAVGDMTAARKVRVFDVPLEEAFARSKRTNSLYLEWFSDRNGRLVIESADYDVSISPPQWQFTPEENEQRARAVDQAMGAFLQRLTDAIEQHKRAQKDHEEPWNEHDYERFFKESDARAEKYGELLEKYGDSDEAEAIIDKEMGWDRELSEEEAEERERWIEEMNRACEEALEEPEPEPDAHREGIDWIRTADGDLRHPLQHRAFENAMKLWHQVKALGLEAADKGLGDFVFEFQITSVKLGGALDGIARGDGFHDPAFTVAYLKRALDHLHKAQAGLEAIAPKDLLPNDMIAEARQELFEIREGILELMDELRRQIDR